MKSFSSRLFAQFAGGFAIAVIFIFSTGTAMSLPVAERIDASNAKGSLSDCPDRIGGIGDWYLSNGTVWAIIDDVSNLNVISAAGGTLVDLGLVGHKGEQFVQLMPFLNMTRDLIVPFDHVQVEQGDTWASITVSTTHGLRPEKPGFGVLSKEVAKTVIFKTEYRLVEGENFLRLKTTITNTGNKKAKIFSVADLIHWGDDAMKPFGGSQKRLGSARGTPRGFQHPLMEPESVFSIVKAIGGFTYAAGGGVDGLPPISYGLCSPTEYNNNRLLWGVNDRMVSVLGPFTGKFNRPFDIWKILFLGIPAGEEFVYERVMVVGEKNDVASSTDIIFPLLGMMSENTGVIGKIEPSGADTSIVIFTEEENLPMTQVRPVRTGEQAGRISALLPPGKYIAKIRSAQRDPDLATPEIEAITRRFMVEDDGFTDVGIIEAPPLSTLLVEVFEGDRRSPARVIIHGAEGTPDPELGDDLLGFTLAGKPTASTYRAPWVLMDGNETGPVRVELRPGKYTIYATHGFEYSVDTAEVDLGQSGAEVAIKLTLEKVLDTAGMMSGDFHVHAAPSMDSAFSLDQRVISFVAEGVDLLVATDHDALTDFTPVISRLNLSHRLTSIVGVEATSTQMVHTTPFTIGHYNSWPLRYEPLLPRRGMVVDDGIRPRDLFDRLKTIADGESIIQVNHGREGEVGEEASYFNALGLDYDKPLAYDPTLPLTESPNNLLLTANSNGTRDIDFDAMEILNGSDYGKYILLKADWFSLLNQGSIKTGTANSDTHIKVNLAGYPRNYIMLKDPKAERVDSKILVEQIHGHRVFGTTGPIIKFDVNGRAGIGDVITAMDGNIMLNIKVLAPDWVPLDEVRIYSNGQKIRTLELDSQSGIVRFDRGIPFLLDKDTWFVVETTISNPPESELPVPPGGLYNIIAPGFVPLAFTNPIFVDVDGNGRYDPPGISRPVTASSSAEKK